MTKGDAGQNISKFASSSTEASQISTPLPYISYVDLGDWLSSIFGKALAAVSAYFDLVKVPVFVTCSGTLWFAFITP